MKQEIFRQRRKRIMDEIAETPFGKGMAIVPAASLHKRTHDVDYPFHQNSDFHYLTSYPEPDAVAVIRPCHEDAFTLFVLPRDKEAETWTGYRFGIEGAKEFCEADTVFTINEFETKLPELLRGYDSLYYLSGHRPALDRTVESVIKNLRARNRDGIRVPSATIDIGSVLHEHRLIKSPEEAVLLEKAVNVSMEGHLAAMRLVRPGLNERDIAAAIEYVFRRKGAQATGFETVVAGGPGACILHYTGNNRTLEENELLLIDAGAMVDGYSGDISRTMPVSGTFSSHQKRVYEIVLKANLEAIEKVKPGLRFEDAHTEAVRIITEGLISLEILKGDIDELIEKEAYKPYFMHRTGHWLGLDVHDFGKYFESEKVSRVLEPGMALTIEPGIYLSENDQNIPPEYRGIGIRIEDDVLVTDEAYKVLSSAMPKTVQDIEEVMREDSILPN